MNTDFGQLLREIATRFHDTRTNLAEIQIEAREPGVLHLSGKVLDARTLDEVVEVVKKGAPGAMIEAGTVRILRDAHPEWMNVAVNLTGVYAQPSWLAEMVTQNTYGAVLEILDEQESWVFIRQADGYLGWMYKPYLAVEAPSEPNYRVCRPFAALYQLPERTSPLTGRIPEGVDVTVGESFGNWLKVDGHPGDLPGKVPGGWVHHATLMPLDDLPVTSEEKRSMIAATAYGLFGVPYLWGGTTANGIDCSGLAQLCYRMAGVTLPRDADMQRDAGKPVTGPAQLGDLIFFTEEGNPSKISHVGISLGDGRVIHSSRKRNGVGVDEIRADTHLRTDFAGAFSYLK